VNIGDLVKGRESGKIGVIVIIEKQRFPFTGPQGAPTGGGWSEQYYCCLMHDFRVWLFEEDMELLA
jgi:hypothetical protein